MQPEIEQRNPSFRIHAYTSLGGHMREVLASSPPYLLPCSSCMSLSISTVKGVMIQDQHTISRRSHGGMEKDTMNALVLRLV